MGRTAGLCATVCIAVLLGVASASSAQEVPRAEFSAGWRLLNVPDAFGGDSETLPVGWYADIAGNLNRAFAVVADLSGNVSHDGNPTPGASFGAQSV